jgi:hypothetical protein
MDMIKIGVGLWLLLLCVALYMLPALIANVRGAGNTRTRIRWF